MSRIPHIGDALTPRETQVCSAIVMGRQTKQIARDLGISPRTVEHHRMVIREKLGAHSVVDIVRISLTKEDSNSGQTTPPGEG